jgi:Tol biopolymer transport system component
MPGIYEKIASGLGGDELMLGSDAALSPSDWSRDGRFILYHGLSPTTGGDLWALPLDGDREPFPVVQTDSDEGFGQFSPDGRWIAYQSNESGRVEIYLSPFPGPGRQWRISTAGGSLARWSPDGNELFYIAPDRSLMSVPIGFANDGQSVDIGNPVPLFDTGVGSSPNPVGATRYFYAVSPDGERFLINTFVEDATSSPITVILNWNPENAL